ncbi:MAG: hypothetical protein H0A75_04560 [Candidatus Methanofishera endochildressiae]|uniref:Uncharacterized protein n=1 Tax=Candidatus Methanofishera endochildressiae TaxID=2738884 RepID=A0A7Z0MPG6_9GAMM|nr:hypothetical protein [Candidatus Methanofishera endochildressiae]
MHLEVQWVPCANYRGNLAAGDSSSVDFGLLVIAPLPSGVNLTANIVTIEDDGNNASGVVLTAQGSDSTPLVAVRIYLFCRWWVTNVNFNRRQG